MELYYKDYELASFKINDNGYLLPFGGKDESLKYYKNEISDYVIAPENNDAYFAEADILSQVNKNKEGYFDFNKAILDIGAHAGYYSFRSDFKYVYAFEPNNFIFQFLNINLIIHNKWENSKTFNVLLSDKKENIQFDGFSTILDNFDRHFKYDKSMNVISHTLDEFNCENVGFIKIDVEGMEEKVLRGGIGTIIRNNYPPILFELWEVGFYGMTQEKHDSLEKFLTDLGYVIFWNWGDYETHLAIHK